MIGPGVFGSRAAARILRRFLAAMGLVLSAAAAVAGQDSRWAPFADTVFQRIATDSGAPNALGPTAVVEDGDGFLWIGTQNGLVRWDGYRFRSYKPDPSTPGSLPDSFVQTLHTDRRGQLWIGTASRGLLRYDKRTDRFIVHAAGPTGLSHASVTSIGDAADGGLWVGTEGGLDHLDPASGQVTSRRHDAADSFSLLDDNISAVLVSRSGELWIGTGSGLARGDAGGRHFVALRLPGEGDGKRKISRLFEDSAGRIWVGTDGHGASIVEPGSGRVGELRETGVTRPTLQTEGITAVAETAAGEIWLGTGGSGIVAVDAQSLRTRRIVHDAKVSASLDSNDIWVLYRDRANLLWAGTSQSLSRHAPGSKAILSMYGASSRRNGLSHEEVISIIPMPDGRLWFGAGTNGVDIFDPDRGLVSSLRPDSRHPATALPAARVIVGLPLATGEVMLGTHQGLYRVDRSGRRVQHIVIPGRSPAEAVWALHQDGRGLWLGGTDGLWLLSPGRQGRFDVHHKDLAPGLADRRITLIQPDTDDRLWIGTRGGLNRLDVATHRVEAIATDSSRSPGMTGGFISSLLTDPQGRLWVATAGAGVHLIENVGSPSEHITHLGSEQGLPNENISKLLADRDGRIWASTDQGLAVIDPTTLAVRSLGPAEGVAISTYWINSGALTATGELLFGGLGGLTIVRLERLSIWAYRPPVVATDVRVDGVSIPVGMVNQPEPLDPVVIAPGHRSLSVEFSALDFSAPERNRYAYRLSGFDPEWIDAEPARRLAVYTNLPPGEHVLEVRGSNRDGGWSPTVFRLPVRVLPNWYQTSWFRLLLVALGSASVVTLVQARTLLLRRRQRELEQQVTERTAALKRRSEELQASERKLAQMAYFDALTGLPNRRMFAEHFERNLGLARRTRTAFALLLIDLDRFKHINDSLGHAAGDALLIEVAERLRREVREVDSVARLGGDEFAMLLSEAANAVDVQAACLRIIDSFAPAIPYGTTLMRTSPSVGVAFFPRHGTTLDELYIAADAALYQAKHAGRNTWRFAVTAETPIEAGLPRSAG